MDDDEKDVSSRINEDKYTETRTKWGRTRATERERERERVYT